MLDLCIFLPLTLGCQAHLSGIAVLHGLHHQFIRDHLVELGRLIHYGSGVLRSSRVPNLIQK